MVSANRMNPPLQLFNAKGDNFKLTPFVFSNTYKLGNYGLKKKKLSNKFSQQYLKKKWWKNNHFSKLKSNKEMLSYGFIDITFVPIELHKNYANFFVWKMSKVNFFTKLLFAKLNTKCKHMNTKNWSRHILI